MSTHQQRTEQALKVALATILSLFAYQGKCLVERIDRLEKNTTRIMVQLGIPPVAVDTLEFQGKTALVDAPAGNQTIQTAVPHPENFPAFSLDEPMVDL